MRTLEKNWRTIYYAKRSIILGVAKFDSPIKLQCNIMPLRTDWTRAEKGEVETGLRKIILSNNYLDIKMGDRFYVETQLPITQQDILTAEGADYEVIGLEPTLNSIGIILKRLAV